MRIVDVVLGALYQALPSMIPAASQGTMNNVAMGNHGTTHPWDYYETIAGGCGAIKGSDGVSGVQSHMTNTLNTPIESLEMHYPIRIREYSIRRGSGGDGRYAGGNGLIREFEFLEPAELTLITERRRIAPWGLEGGASGVPGKNLLDGKILPGKCHLFVEEGQVLRVETPGGGGVGLPQIN
jgi:N-methylhydantoinase B